VSGVADTSLDAEASLPAVTSLDAEAGTSTDAFGDEAAADGDSATTLDDNCTPGGWCWSNPLPNAYFGDGERPFRSIVIAGVGAS
jgi:hypothetical protein